MLALQALDIAAGTTLSAIKTDRPQLNGNIEANAGVMGIKTPFLRIRRNKDYNPTNLESMVGLPSNSYVSLGSLKGYTVVKDVFIDIQGATQSEKDKIENMLKGGVIL